jgi:hypothetical protein
LKKLIRRSAVVATVGALAAIVIAGPVRASGGDSATGSEAAPANTVLMVGTGHSVRFVSPKTIIAGEELTIENRTNSRKVGPHTFSLVDAADIPKSKKQRKLCFTPNHICKSIADWHGVKGEGPPTKNPADYGKKGWDAVGSLKKKGDSWFTGQKPNASYSAPVTVSTANGPQTLTFMCAIHPWMHGSIEVLPPTGG